jgi:hypothetical protein
MRVLQRVNVDEVRAQPVAVCVEQGALLSGMAGGRPKADWLIDWGGGHDLACFARVPLQCRLSRT